MHKEYFMALLMLISLILLLCIFINNRRFLFNNKEDLSILFYGERNKSDVSWHHAIFIFFIIFSVDSFLRKTLSRDRWVFFPEKGSKNKPFGMFPNAYESNLNLFLEKNYHWVKKYWILNFFFIFFASILLLFYMIYN